MKGKPTSLKKETQCCAFVSLPFVGLIPKESIFEGIYQAFRRGFTHRDAKLCLVKHLKGQTKHPTIAPQSLHAPELPYRDTATLTGTGCSCHRGKIWVTAACIRRHRIIIQVGGFW